MVDLPCDDRGFTLGDGLFETILAKDGKLAHWDLHLARLERGCQALGLPPPDAGACHRAAEAALTEAGLGGARAAVRLTWTAGSGGRGLDRPPVPQPRLVATAAPSSVSAAPVRLVTSSVRRNDGSPASRLKSLAYIDNVLARREARAAGGDEAVMLNTRGEVACAAAANLFWVRARTLFTPALECGVLDGVTRGLLMARAQAQGWSVREVRAGPEALEAADAVLLTNSLTGVRAVERVDDLTLEPAGAVAALAALLD